MKIAIFHELHSGGARRAVNEFAKKLSKDNQVDLYIVDSREEKSETKLFSIIYFFKFIARNWEGGNWKARLYKDSVELYKLNNLHKKIASKINRTGYDVVFVHPSKYTQAPFILKFLKPKTVYYCQEGLRFVYEKQFQVDKSTPLHKRLYENFSRYIRMHIDKVNIKNADLVLANSKNTQSNILRAYGIKSRVVYLGVDTQFFKPMGVKKDIDVLYLGAGDATDGYFLLQDAEKLLHRGIKVKYHITGRIWLSDTDLRKLYNRAKTVVCLAKNEPFGLIPLEAAACGVPVIALESGGYKETVIDGATGLFVSERPKELADKIKLLLSNKKMLEKMGTNTRKNVEQKWTWEASLSHLMGYLNT